MFIIMYFFDHGFTTWHKAKDAWIGMGTIGLLFLVTALYYLRRDVAGVWVSVHRPASMWALVVLCTAALIVIGVVRDDHEDMILRHRHWRQVTLFAVFGSLLVYSFFSALWVSRAVIARAWPDHRLPTPLMRLLGALTCGLCAATVFDVRAVFGMPSEMARGLLGGFLGTGSFLLVAALYTYGVSKLRRPGMMPSLLWALVFALVAALGVLFAVRDSCGVGRHELWLLCGVLSTLLGFATFAALAASPAARDDWREWREYAERRVPRAATRCGARRSCASGRLVCCAILGHHGLARHVIVLDNYYCWGALGSVCLLSACVHSSEHPREAWAKVHTRARALAARDPVHDRVPRHAALARLARRRAPEPLGPHRRRHPARDARRARALLPHRRALRIAREAARVSWKWYMLVFSIVAVVVVAGVLLLGLFLPYDQRFRLAHHNPAQWRAACRAFPWGLLWATCAAFFLALEFFLLAFVELGRTLLAETLLCLIGVACVFGAQHTPYVDEDLAVVLYVALAMGAWCFLISAIVWCYCITSVGTEWGLDVRHQDHRRPRRRDAPRHDVLRLHLRPETLPLRCYQFWYGCATCQCCEFPEMIPGPPDGGEGGGKGQGGGAAEDGGAAEAGRRRRRVAVRAAARRRAARHHRGPEGEPERRRRPTRPRGPTRTAAGGDGGDGADVAGGDDAAAAAPESGPTAAELPVGTPVEWVLWFGLLGLIGGLVATKIVWDDSNMPTETAIVLYATLGTLCWAWLVWAALHLALPAPADAAASGARAVWSLARLEAWSAARAPDDAARSASTSRASRSSWSAAPSGRAAAASTRRTRGA